MNRKAWYILNRRDFKATNIGGCILWLRGDMGITPNGANVAGWADQSGQGNDAAQATPTDQPAFEAAGGPNGTPCVTFDAANTEYMSVAGMTDASHDYTVFCVYDPVNKNAHQAIFSSSISGVFQHAVNATSTGIYDGTAWRTCVENSTASQIVAWRLDSAGTSFEVFRDGTKLGSGTYDGTWAWASPTLGAHPAPGWYFNGKLAEIIIYNRKLTDAEMALVHAYLSARYAIAFDLKTSIAGNILWLDAALGVTSTGSGVSEWRDQGPSGFHAAQSTDADRPLWGATSGVNGLPGITFDQSNTEWLDVLGMTNTSNDATVIGVCEPTTTASTAVLLGCSGADRFCAQRASGYYAGYFDGTAWRQPVISTTEPQMLTWKVDSSGPTVDIYRDGYLIGSSATDGTMSWGATCDVGAANGGQTFNGTISQLIAYNHALTDEELALVHAHLEAKFAISFSPLSVADCTGYWDGALGKTIATGVSNWANYGSAGNDVANATGAEQPTETTIGTVAALRFDGSDDYLQYSGAIADWKHLHDGTGSSIFIYAKPAAIGDTNVLLDTGVQNAARHGIRISHDDGVGNERPVIAIPNGAGSWVVSDSGSNNSWPHGVAKVLTCRIKTGAANEYEIRMDGSLCACHGAFAVAPSANNPSDALTFGAEADTTNDWPGDIGRVAMFSRYVSDTERVAIETWMAA